MCVWAASLEFLGHHIYADVILPTAPFRKKVTTFPRYYVITIALFPIVLPCLNSLLIQDNRNQNSCFYPRSSLMIYNASKVAIVNATMLFHDDPDHKSELSFQTESSPATALLAMNSIPFIWL